ncbi:hypothetical protein L3Q82_000040 [Scortum barcoo]|uniref:Uncharacterized protein n=1 Tax=Scortum barcoo TaxID=214431 RepID=A0ACB8XAU5_9TELE|nr:hypothetical protein L3Q82_000040 [Scortum barcoo]
MYADIQSRVRTFLALISWWLTTQVGSHRERVALALMGPETEEPVQIHEVISVEVISVEVPVVPLAASPAVPVQADLLSLFFEVQRRRAVSGRSVVEKTFIRHTPPVPAYNRESPWRSLPVVEPEQRRRRRKRGSRAGVLVRLRKRENRPPLPSILLANVQSLDNKLDELRSRMAFQRDIKNCNVLVFTETWLDPSIPDSAIVPEGLSIPPTGPDNSFREEQGRRCLLHGEQQVVFRCGDYFYGLFSGPGAPHDQMPALLSSASAFNTIVPSKLVTKLRDLGINSALCDWILNFLTGRPQAVRMGSTTSSTLTLNTRRLKAQGCVLSPSAVLPVHA